MKTFKVEIKETHFGVFDVEAETTEEAKLKLEADYWKHPNDFYLEPKETEFRVVKGKTE